MSSTQTKARYDDKESRDLGLDSREKKPQDLGRSLCVQSERRPSRIRLKFLVPSLPRPQSVDDEDHLLPLHPRPHRLRLLRPHRRGLDRPLGSEYVAVRQRITARP